MGKQVIYSSFFSQEKYEKAKQSLKEIGIENINEDDISDQMLFFLIIWTLKVFNLI